MRSLSDGIDNDGNGYVDDVEGWDFIDQDNNPNPNGLDNHGTHVAGIAAGRINNGLGIAGTAGGATIMPVKFYDGGRSSLWTGPVIRESFEYAVDNGARIVSTSYNINGWVGDPNFTAGIQYILDSGALHFNSAGNGSELNPARQAFQQTLLVASTESNDQLSGFSNYGTGVDISAPGGSILSTIPTDTYDYFSGTSMATPNAAGVAALIWSHHPTWTNYQVAAQLVGTADNIDAANPGRVGLLGGGRVNSFQALTEALAAPQITSLFGVPEDGSVTENTSITSFQVDFDKVLDPTSANTASNFELLNAGTDGVFGTADDETVATSLASQYMVGSNQVTINVDSGSLEVGEYRLRVVAGGIVDPFGAALDGDADGVAGGDYQTFFSVVNPFKSSGPVPSLISQRTQTGASLGSASDVDIVRFYAEAGETITAVARPSDPAAMLTLEVPGVAGPVSAVAAGESLTLPITTFAADGQYEFLVTTSAATEYSLDIYRNVDVSGLIETPADISLDGSKIELGSARYAALAKANGVTGDPSFDHYNNAASFVDISTTGIPLGLADDGEATISTSVGNLLMPAGPVTIGNNGMIAAGGGVTIDFSNDSIPSTDFSNAALMPFWDDIDSETGNVYWQETQLNGVNALIVQWEGRPHYNGIGAATFQIQLFESGPVLARYAYEDVDFGNSGFNGGASATIGFQADDQLYGQFSYNSDVLENGDVIDITLGSPAIDIDSFTVDLSSSLGQRLDLYVQGASTSFAMATVELLDPTNAVVATATSNGSFDLAIFDAPIDMAGVYTVRVSAGFAGDYYLVLTDHLAIDSEPNNSPAAARNLNGMSGVLGNMSGGAIQHVRYNDIGLFVDISSDGTALNLGDDDEATINTTVGNTLFPAGPTTIGNNGVVASGAGVSVGTGNEALPTTDFFSALSVFWDDIDSDSGNVYWSERQVNGIETLIVQWDSRPHFSNVGDATFQLQLFAAGPVAARFVYKDVDFGDSQFDFGASATVGVQSDPFTGLTIVDEQASLANGDVIDFNTFEQDVFRIDLSPGEAVTVTTTTPFDDANNEPLNDLDVDLQLLDANENTVASDTDSAGDGRNALLTYASPSGGTYFIAVGSAAGTGNYVLRVTSTTGVDGDFDDDGDYDCDDIDALTNAVAAGSFDANFDLSGDGLALNLDDVDAWLAEAAEANGFASAYLYGDANLDGNVDVTDFNIWNGQKFTLNANWCDGDFNADGVIDVSDFNLLNGNIFTGIAPLLRPDNASGSKGDEAVAAVSVQVAMPSFAPVVVGRHAASTDLRNHGVRRNAVDRVFGEEAEQWSVVDGWDKEFA